MVSQVVVWAGVDLSGSTPAQYLAEHETEHRHFIANTSIVTGGNNNGVMVEEAK